MRGRFFTLARGLAAVLLLFVSTTALAAEQGGHEELAHGNAGEQMTDASEFKTDLAIYTVAVFLLLLAILNRFAWPPIMTALVEREKRIEGNIASAEAMQEEAKQLLAQHEAELASAADQVRALLEEARRDAEYTKSQILAEAKQAADAERDRSVREVQRAADNAMKDLAQESANLAVELAGKVVRLNITPDQQSQLVRDALSKLTAAEPSKN